jgi:tetratricopeptide (TPR) repeat protein
VRFDNAAAATAVIEAQLARVAGLAEQDRAVLDRLGRGESALLWELANVHARAGNLAEAIDTLRAFDVADSRRQRDANDRTTPLSGRAMQLSWVAEDHGGLGLELQLRYLAADFPRDAWTVSLEIDAGSWLIMRRHDDHDVLDGLALLERAYHDHIDDIRAHDAAAGDRSAKSTEAAALRGILRAYSALGSLDSAEPYVDALRRLDPDDKLLQQLRLDASDLDDAETEPEEIHR